MGTWVRMVALGIVFVLLVGGRVAAAPQILGLLATAKPIPLSCAQGMCSAEFSAFCMQRHRRSPAAGTAYRAAKGTELTLIYTDQGGTKRSLSASNRVIIKAHRDFHVVRIALPESEIRGLGGRDLAIAVGALASLVPIAQPGDKVPLDKQEIAYITGPHRLAVAKAFSDDGESIVAVRTINRLINALPQGRTPTKQRSDLWRKVIGDLPTQHTGAGLRWAAREFQFCKRWAGYGLRDCLAEGHDHKALDLTKKAWKISEPGS